MEFYPKHTNKGIQCSDGPCSVKSYTRLTHRLLTGPVTNRLSGSLLCLPPLHVTVIHIQEHVPAWDACIQFGADEEGAGHLAVEGVRLLRRWGEAVA